MAKMDTMKTRCTSSPRFVRRALVLASVAALGLTACGSAEEAVTERILEEAAGEGVDVELGEDGEVVSIETDEGSMEIGTGGELPAEWPADVPTFDDGTITGSQVYDSNGEMYVLVSYASQTDPAEAVEAMKASLEEAGFSIISDSNMTDGAGAGLSSIVAERENVSVTFSANGAPGEDTVVQASVIIKPA
jgi:hypothetical protein